MSQFSVALQNVASIIQRPEAPAPVASALYVEAFRKMITLAQIPMFADDPGVQRHAGVLTRAVEALLGKELTEAERAGLIYDLIELSGNVAEEDDDGEDETAPHTLH